MTDSYRILIVDDEQLARQRVARYIAQFSASASTDFLIEEAESGVRAVELIAEFRPDVIFLDIEMPGLNGFEVLQQFEERPFQIVFQTAYDQFAIRAFEEHAMDYLLKPFPLSRLHEALRRALARVADEERLRALETQLASRAVGAGYLRRLTVKCGNRLRLVEEQAIQCFISRDHYTCIYFDEGAKTLEGICDLSLARLAERLDPQKFRQLHRNNIARVDSIVSLARSRQGDVWVELKNGMRLPVSRSNQNTAKELINK